MAGAAEKDPRPRWEDFRPGLMWRDGRSLGAYVWRRFAADRCMGVAASLSYTTLLALVPLMAIGFAMLAAFPVFDAVRQDLQDFAFENFVPSAGEAVREQMSGFLERTGQLTAVGTAALAITALMLLNTLETTFNAVWRVARPRRLIPKLLTYWGILTLSPLILGTSVVLSGYIFTLTRMLDVEAFTGLLGGLLRLVPFLLLIAGFTLIYVVIPNRAVRWRHAFTGALVAALLFEGLKKLFGYYVGNFPGYQTIYGALSALPLFLVWMYVAWGAVLFGAEIAASLPEWRGELRRARSRTLRPGERLGLALGILALLLAARRDGRGLGEEEISAGLAADPEQVAQIIEALAAAGTLAEAADETWMLARDLDEVGLYELHRIMGLGLTLVGDGLAEDDAGALEDGEWRRRVAALFAEIDAAERDLMRGDLRSLLSAPEGEEAARPHIRPVG